MKYALCLLLNGGIILGEEKKLIHITTQPCDTIEEVVKQNKLLSFVTEKDIKILEDDVNRGLAEKWSPEDFGELGGIGGIWCREDCGSDYIYDSNAIDIEGVYEIAIICVF